MLGDDPIMTFIPSVDLERARDFYEGTLGLTVEEVNGFACVLRGAGTMVRVTRVETLTPQPFTVLGWQVDDIAEPLAQLRGKGVEPLRFDGMAQDADGVWTAPGGARIAWFHDPDGNTLSLTQF